MQEGLYIGISKAKKRIENISEEYNKIAITKNNLRDKKDKILSQKSIPRLRNLLFFLKHTLS